MFERTSRYHDVEQATMEVTDGAGVSRIVTYARRRFVPPRPTVPPAVMHVVSQDDRLDLIANRYLGDPTLFWHLADGSDELDPDELTAAPGSSIAIHLPGLGIA